MKFKKLTALVLTAVMAVSSLAACGDTKDQSNADSGKVQEGNSETQEQSSEQSDDSASASEGIVFPLEENMTFTMTNTMNGETSVTDTWGWQQLEEMTNVSFEMIEFTAGECNEKVNLLLAGGDYPEAFFRTPMDYDKYGEEGILIPLEDLIREYAPNLTALLDERDLWDVLASDDGHIYVMPDVRYTEILYSWLLSYNAVWLDNLGLDVPTNMDEFYEVLKAIKEQDANGNGDPNDEVPLVCSTGAFMIQCLLPYFATEGIINIGSYMCLDTDNNEVSFYPMSEEFKEILATLAQWYDEGLINSDCFTMDYQEYLSIGKSSDQYGFIWGDPVSAVGDRQNCYAYIEPVEGSQGLPANSGIEKSGFAISDKCENPEVLVAWCDNFYDLEIRTMAGNGQQGVDWEYDENGKIVSLGTGNPVIAGTTYTPGRTDAAYHAQFAGVISAVTGEEIENKIPFMERLGVSWPKSVWVDEDTETRYDDLQTNIRAVVNNYIATVVIGEKSLEDTWDDYLAELEKLGVQEYVEIGVSALGDDYVAVY